MRRILILKHLTWFLLIMALTSCATIKRALTIDKSDSSVSVAQLDSLFHPENLLESRMYSCSVPGPERRRVLVYLPADYYQTSRSYPVLYLIHGARGNELSWIKDGDVLASTDRLWKEGASEKYILVLPNMNSYEDDADYDNSRFKMLSESFFEIDGTVEYSFVNDLVGFVDSNYRTLPQKASRAIAGLSVGAMQAAYISAAYPDSFDYIGLFSPFVKAPIQKGEHSDFYSSLRSKQKVQFSTNPALYKIYIGYWDVFYNHVEEFRRYCHRNGFKVDYYESSGGHDWKNWSSFYVELSKELFR